jgi:3-oxoacyl-[acyl-carrier protein] reductase
MYKDRIVVVTGTSRGVGKEIAEHFIRNSAVVIGLSRSNATIEDHNYTHFNVDVGNPNDVTKIFRLIGRQFKRIDIVINNAAVLTSQYSMIMPIKNAVDMVNVNLLGPFFVSREAAKLMRNNTYGRIINIGSMAASLEPIGDSVYAACKKGISTLANVMAKEYGPMNVTCNTLGITAIESEMLAQLPRHKIDEIIKNLPLPRYAQIDDILNVIDFYANPRSSYITAQTIFLGGIN